MAVGFTVVFPVFLLLILGNLARRSGFLDEAFWEQAERWTYYILFPALLVTKLAQADFDWQASGWLVLAALVPPPYQDQARSYQMLGCFKFRNLPFLADERCLSEGLGCKPLVAPKPI